MPRKVPHIPPQSDLPESREAVVQVLRYITAQSKAPIAELATAATLAETAAKINEVIRRLQCG